MSTPVADLPPPTWTTGSTEVFHTGSWRAAIARHVRAPSPCHQACPVGGEIAAWIGRARERDWRGAWDLLTRHNPFPAVAGRVCHHPCEAACNRTGFDEAISIRGLERFVGDLAIAEGWRFAAPAVERDGHVAVVGAGPAGLSAAFQLRRRGWRVTVHDAGATPGGLMRNGIPTYRLAREVLDAEIARIEALGVDIRCGSAVADADAFARLREAHDAVFVATGAARVKRLPGIDATLPGVLDGSAYLAACNAGAAPLLGRDVVVVGGGSAAIDAARSARRGGHAVTLLALESRAQLPAQPDEVAEALDEGVALRDGAMLNALRRDAGRLRLHCRRVRFVPGARRGEFSVEPAGGDGFELRADALIVSIGQDPDLAPFGATLPAEGALLHVDPATQATGADRVWAGGDVASLDRFVTAAVGMGERAAIAIDRRLRGACDADTAEGTAVALAAIATWYHEPAARARAALRPVAERLRSGAEVQLGLGFGDALAEAARCFSCGTCIECDNCITVCPDLAVRRAAGGGYEVLGDYCKGCGLCVRECPTGSMAMRSERR